MTPTEKDLQNLAKLFIAARDSLLDTIINYNGVGTKVYANTVYKQLEEMMRQLEAASTGFAFEAVPAEYQRALADTYEYFKKNNLQMLPPAAFAQLHTDTIYGVAREMQYLISDGIAQVGRQIMRYADDARDEALRAAGLAATGEKLASGGTVRQMQKNLVDKLQKQGFMTVQYGSGDKARQVSLDAYASMVARSTTREAGNLARTVQLTANGYDLVKMTEHYPTCEKCARYQGRVFSISGNDKRFPSLATAFPGLKYMNVHPNCFVSGTPILAQGVMAHSCRDYIGKVVAIEIAGGDKLTVTPNHPILTSKGWVVAGALLKGDKVAKYNGIDELFVRKNPNDIDIPTAIEDIPHTIGQAFGVSTYAVKTTAEQFHGDGVDSKIAIVNTYCFLRSKRIISFLKKITKLFFILRRNISLCFDTVCAFAQIGIRKLRTSHGIVCGRGKCRTLINSQPRHSNTHGLRRIFGPFNSSVTEPSLNSALINAKVGCDRFFAFAVNVTLNNFVRRKLYTISASFCTNCRTQLFKTYLRFFGTALNHSFADAQNGRNLINALAGKIEFLDIIDVKIDFFHGKVYNLQTKNGWYLANNIITHNCRHSIHPWVESLKNPEEIAKEQEQSNKPFEDTRPEAEKELYTQQQLDARQMRQDRYQYERYRAMIGENAPKSFHSFRQIKKAGGEDWDNLQYKYNLYSRGRRKGVLPNSPVAATP